MKKIKFNGVNIEGISISYDSCHKIYINETPEDEEEMKGYGYTIHDLDRLEDIWDDACNLRFIRNTQMTKLYIPQED